MTSDDVRRDRNAQACHEVDAWLSRGAMERLVQLFGGRPEQSESNDLIDRLVALEDFGDFCWNFRQGNPRGVLHLFKRTIDPSFRGDLPLVAVDRAWNEGDPRDLLKVYLGQASETADILSDADSSLRHEVEDYPDVNEGEYKERWEAVAYPFSADAAHTVEQSAAELDVLRPGTPKPPYDHILVLGGGGRSPLLRAEYAKEVIDRYGLAGTPVWLLGSPRPIEERVERGIASAYAPGAVDEYDLMVSGGLAAFGGDAVSTELVCGCSDPGQNCVGWVDRYGDPPADMNTSFQHERHGRLVDTATDGSVHVLSASTSNPPDRPNTADTYALFAKTVDLTPGDRLLIITTQVFVPFQRFDALRMLYLPFGAEVDVIGFGADRGDRPATPGFFLQEILSGVRSAGRLVNALDDMT